MTLTRKHGVSRGVCAANSLLDAQGSHRKVLWDQATMKPKNRDTGRFFLIPC
jgi:hypothetical protein